MPSEFSSTRDAYLFFSITGTILAVLLFIVYLFNMTEATPLKKLPIELVVKKIFNFILKKNIN